MAHFGRPREKFSNGTLPKPKPYTKEMFKKQSDLYLQGYFGAEDKELYKNNLENVFKKGVEEGVVSEEEALKWIQDRKKIYSTLIEEAGKQPAEFPPAYSVEPDINKYYENQLATGGRVNGRLKAAAFLLAPALLPYAAAFLGAVGATAAWNSPTGLALQQKIQNYFTDKPEEVTKFKEYLKTQNVPIDREPENWSPSFANKKEDLTHKSVPVDVGGETYIGDTGQKEEERERILEEENKKLREGKWGSPDDKINIPTDTAHPPHLPEKWTPPDTIPPQIKVEPETFPDLSEEFNKPQILTSETAEKIKWPASIHPDQKQKVTEVLDKQKKKIPELKTKEDYERFITDIETSGLNHKNKSLVLTDEYKEALKHYVETFHDSNVSRAIKNIPLNNQSLGARLKGTDFMAKGSHSKSILDIEVGDKTFPEAMNDLQHNYEPAMAQIKKKLKDAGISLEDYAHVTDLANIVGIDSKNMEQRDQLLRKMRLFFEPIRGEDNTYHIGDFLEKISSYIKDTRYDITGEGIKPGQQYIERVEKINPGLKELKDSASGKINRKLKASGFELVDSDGRTISLKDHMGHVESTDVMSKYPKIFEDSDAESIQTLLNQDRVVNIDILVDRGYHTKNDAIYEGVTDGTMTIKEANQKLKDNHERVVKIIKGKAEELPYFKNKEKSVALMQIGKNGKITVDMSTIDKQYIYGKINEINPTATQVSDLSKEEKALYESNLRDQYVDSAYNFLTNMKDDKGERIYSRDEITDFLDEFYTKNTYKYRMQKGGPVYGKYANQIKNLKIP